VIDVINESMMVCGIYGYKNDTPYSVGRHLRDAHQRLARKQSRDRMLVDAEHFEKGGEVGRRPFAAHVGFRHADVAVREGARKRQIVNVHARLRTGRRAAEGEDATVRHGDFQFAVFDQAREIEHLARGERIVRGVSGIELSNRRRGHCGAPTNARKTLSRANPVERNPQASVCIRRPHDARARRAQSLSCWNAASARARARAWSKVGAG
jgi:hypothetical protein